ncbi:MAG: Mov34/MPN/PAD-1 family protein, partial [Nitrososphaerota archaeon]
MVIKIPRKIMDEMSRHALRAYPEEGCGLLIGVINSGIREIVKCIPMSNVYEGSRRNRYSIDPLEYMKIEDEAYRN